MCRYHTYLPYEICNKLLLTQFDSNYINIHFLMKLWIMDFNVKRFSSDSGNVLNKLMILKSYSGRVNLYLSFRRIFMKNTGLHLVTAFLLLVHHIITYATLVSR